MTLRILGMIMIIYVLTLGGLAPWAHAAGTIPGCYYFNQNLGSEIFIGQPNNGVCPNGPNGETGFALDSAGNRGTAVSGNLTYTPLEPISSTAQNKNPNFCDLLSLIFKALIYVGGMVAVLYLVLGGITYMVSEVVDKRSKARDRIRAAVWGLVILLASWIILNTINPQLVKACIVLNPADSNGVISTQSTDPVVQARQSCQANGGQIRTGTVTQMATDIRAAALTAGSPLSIAYLALRYFVGSRTEDVPGTCGELAAPGSACTDIKPGEICVLPIPQEAFSQTFCTNTGGDVFSTGCPNSGESACLEIPGSDNGFGQPLRCVYK